MRSVTSLAAAFSLLASGSASGQTIAPQAVLETDAVPAMWSGRSEASVPVRQTQPGWSVEAAGRLLAAIPSLRAEGLEPDEYRADALHAAIQRGPGPQLDTVAAATFIAIAEDLRDGRTPESERRGWMMRDPDEDTISTGALMDRVLVGEDPAAIFAELAPTHPHYAALRSALAKESSAARRATIRANMDRWRWLPRDLGGQYLLVNVPEYRLDLMVNGQSVRTYRTVVGKPGSTATPQMAESVEGVVFNPTWTVPQSIVVGEGLGRRVLANPRWARANGYTATRGANGYVSVVQASGPGNSLGAMKLDMPNPEAIFLHDTPAKALFDRKTRALSHGCIRTEDALELALTVNLLGQGASVEEALRIAESGEYTQVPVARPIPVYIVYFTLVPDGAGGLVELGDAYRRDAPVLAALQEARPAPVRTAGM